MEYDKVLTYLISIATLLNLLTGTVKNIQDMRKGKQKKKRRSPGKKKRRK